MIDVPIAAISTLNTHARKGGAWSNVSSAIYNYKTLAAFVLGLEGRAPLRFVRWTGECAWCNNGRYTIDWRDNYTVRCRDCGGTGRRTLRFTETVLPPIGEAGRWHHPWEGRTNPGYELARDVIGYHQDPDDGLYRDASGRAIEWHDARDWKPNARGGQRLELAELLPLLNQVEDWVEATGIPAGLHWPWKRARDCLVQHKHRHVIGPNSHAYQLDLGGAPGGCFVCGDTTDLAGFGYGRLSPLFHWSLPVCRRHGEGPDKVAHPTDPPPDALITPEVRRWLDRHQRVEVIG